MAVVERERRGRVGIVTLNRPEARNAVNRDVATGVEDALDEFERDDDLRVVVITGRGPTFCAGADLKMIASGHGTDGATKRGGFGGVASREFPKPLIAAVNGPALAGGFEIVLACDMVVAADDATFGIPEVRRGLFAAAGGLIRLPRRVALPLATELALTGDPIDARRAYTVGLVNRIVPAERVLDEALVLADRIAEHPPLGVLNARRMIRESPYLSDEDAWARSNQLAIEVFRRPESIEGASAFSEKRAPTWSE